MSETKELNTKDATKHQTEIDILEGNRKMSEDEFDEDEMHLDEELDEYLKLYYNTTLCLASNVNLYEPRSAKLIRL